ncbi:MAG TPA: hypothetical protein VER76_12910, partial [Pyrinomonadaceae bacterium]|nr:hypothetical protein [Pyrinomonadaceae bacterium]
MAYQVIARKWRPQAFEEVTGQEPITRTLRGALEHERLHHAYLFSGARGVGKTTTARLLAKALNCHKAKRPTPAPCKTTDADQCPSCREVAEGRSIDVLEIDAASNTGVDNVRDVDLPVAETDDLIEGRLRIAHGAFARARDLAQGFFVDVDLFGVGDEPEARGDARGGDGAKLELLAAREDRVGDFVRLGRR